MVTGFLHPGAMGASLAAVCRGERLWVGDGRSAATRERAEAAGMVDAGSLAALVERADVIVSVCPPGAALDVAEAVAATGFGGIYADVNATSPATAKAIGRKFRRFVDGGVIGPPVGAAGATRLYLSGDEAAELAALWDGSALTTRLIDGGAGAASAVKICFAAWTKGSAALLLAVRALAAAEGVEEALLAEWAASIGGLAERSADAGRQNAPKAWRFVGEMHEIADSFAAHGLPGEFGAGAAEIYRRLSGFKDAGDPALADVIEALVHPAGCERD